MARTKKLQLTERQIERQVVDLLTAHGWRVLRTNVFAGAVIQRQGSIEPGIPDLMAWRRYDVQHPGYPCFDVRWLEIKRPGGRLNSAQQRWWAAHREEEKRVATCIEDVGDLI